MSDRGEYRSIRRVLLDGPDFQRLPERARWVFVALKLTSGPTGIDVMYPDALASRMATQTGASVRQVRLAMDTLEQSGWIRRESNMLWICGHLNNDPHFSSDDPKHRKAIQKHVAGLPRLRLVRDFVEAQPDWFPPSEALLLGLGWAFEGPSEGHRSREKEKEEGVQEGKGDTSSSSSAREELLRKVPNRRAWEQEFVVTLQGMHGVTATDEQIEQACRDYLANGAAERPNLSHWRGYLRRVVTPPPTASNGQHADDADAALAAWAARGSTR